MRTGTWNRVGALAVAAMVVAGTAASLRPLQASAARSAAMATKAPWLTGVTAPHRQLFDAPQAETGIALVHVMNYYDTYNASFGVEDADIDAVLTFYGGSTFYGVNDAMWAKYQIGEFIGAKDPDTGAPATRNLWRTKPVVLGLSLPQASIESLHARGTTMIVCNNALQIFAGLLAARRGLRAETVYEDLKANLLPQMQLVPAMVIAIEQATRAGLTYHRQ